MSRRRPERRPVRRHRHPVVWSVFGTVSTTALVVGFVLAVRSDAPPRVVVATVVGVLLFSGIAALVLAGNLSPGGGGDSSYSIGDFSSSDGGGGDSGGGDGGGGGGGGSW